MRSTAGNLCKLTNHIYMSWTVVITCCLLGACTTVVPELPQEVPVSVAPQLSALDYYAWVKSASVSELEVELFGLTISPKTADPLINAVRTSMILATSALATDKSTLEALALIQEVALLEANDDISNAYSTFAEVLQLILQQRSDLQLARSTNQKALKEIDILKSRNKQFQQQIEELTSIEQQIIQREQLNTRDP